MSVVGFDFGNESSVVAVARQRGIDVVLNDESKLETPSIVCFGEKQRFIGVAGAASSTMNPKNSISQVKRLIGRRFSDPELQRDLKSLPFNVTEGPDGYPLIHARYLGEMRTFTPTQVLGMVLSDLKSIAEKNLKAAVVDCCIGIPVYFTDLQRRAVLDAAKIAGLHPLHLIHETTATALAYGIYKTDLPENYQLNVAFVDIGHASIQVCIVGFKKGQLKILAHSCDRSLGGRDFDEVLFHHFAAKFKEEYKIDVFQNARACIRLRTACEKLKKVLSANPKAPLNIECLMDEKDVRGFIKREDFEQISAPILQRVKRPLEKALADAKLAVEDVHTVEVVGSASRVPAMLKILTEFFGKEPRRTMNASESVARGCALQCAILSPTFNVRDFQVNESFPFSISLSWKGSASDVHNGGAEQQQLIFPKGNSIPSVKAVTFHRMSTFSVDVQYSDVTDLQIPAKISTHTIGPFPTIRSERSILKAKVRLNLHGIVSLESATVLEEEDVDVPVSKEPTKGNTKMETDEAPCDTASPGAIERNVNMQDAKGTADDAAAVENDFPESSDKPVQMETDTKVEASKKKVKKTNVPVSELVYGAMLPADVQKAVEKEFEMALQDRVMEETKDKKNVVEAYVYDMRNKLSDKYHDFVTTSEKEQFTAKLQETEDWLYEDGEDETKGVYVDKLEELKKQGDPIEERYREYTERGTVTDKFAYCINSYNEATMSNDPKFDHIELAEKQKVLIECTEAEALFREKKQQQDRLLKYATPVLLPTDVRRKAEALDRMKSKITTQRQSIGPFPSFALLSQKNMEGNKNQEAEQKKRRLYNRCYPKKIISEFNEMKKRGETNRMKSLKSIGFYAMAHLRLNQIHIGFIQFICDNFLQSQMKIDLGGGQFLSLTEDDVERVYNLPRGAKKITLSSCEKEDIIQLKNELDVTFNGNSKELVNLTDIHSRLGTYQDDKTWKKAIVLCCIGYVLCPTPNGLINLRYAMCLKNVDEVPEFNWCMHILEHFQKYIKKNATYPSADFNFLMVHVMDTLENGTTSTEAPTCKKWSKDQIFGAFNRIIKEDGFANAIADKLLVAEQSMSVPSIEKKKDETAPDVKFASVLESQFNAELNNINQMPSAESCKNLQQCNQYIDYCKYNIKAWTNYLQKMKKKKKELKEIEKNQENLVAERSRKRKLMYFEDNNEKKSEMKVDTHVDSPT